MVVLAFLSLGAASAQTTLFFDDFENGANDATSDDTTGGYSQTPDVDAGDSDGNTSGDYNPELWVFANQGFGSDRQGLVDESHGDFTDPVGEQAYAFRYTNSGLTTAAGVIGPALAGVTYTVTFDVVEDGHNNATPYDVGLVTFNGGARNDMRPLGKNTTKVLATASGNAPAGGAYAPVSFSYTVDPIADASIIGHDLAIQLDGATTSAIIDNVEVEADYSALAYWDTNGTTTGSGGATPSGTWDAATANWNPQPDGTDTTAPWIPGLTSVFAAGSDATGTYSVTVDGTQNIDGLFVEEGSVSLVDGTSGGLNMTASSTLFVAPGGNLTVEVPFTDATGTELLTRGGDGMLTLDADNSGATGGMELSGGVTQFESAASINGTTENLTVNPGGIMAFGASFGAGNIPTALADRVVTTSGGVIAVDGYDATDFDFSTGTGADLTNAYLGAIANTTYTGLFTPNGTTYRLGGAGGKLTLTDTNGMDEASPDLDIVGEVEISGNITAVTGTMTKQNSGTLTLSGANSYSANTTASGGVLRLAGSNSAATDTTVNAATLQLASASNGGLASGGLTLNNNSARLEAVDDDRTISNDVLLNSSPKIIGTQSLTIDGELTSNNNRTLYNNIDAAGKELELAGQVNLSNNDSSRTLTLRSDINSANIRFNVTGNIVDGGLGACDVTLRSAFRDNEPFYFSGTNTYTGKTEIENGTLFIQGIQALSPDTHVRLNHTSGNNGKIWLLDDTAGTINLPNTFEIYTNNATGNHTIFVGNNNTANGGTSSGTTTGTTVVISELNSVFLKGDTQYQEVNILGANDYSLQIDAVELNNLTSRNAGDTTESRLNPTSANVSIGDITMAAGNMGAGADGVPLLVLKGTSTGNEVTGVISDASDALTTGQPLPLSKEESGTWTLSGANTYTGTTTVENGTLLVNGSLDPASAVAVDGGILGGSGTVGGTVTVASGAGMAPGASAGTLSIGGGLDISGLAGADAGSLDFELDTIGASDQIAVTGSLTIGTDLLGLADFTFTDLGGLQNGTYTLISSGGLSGSLDPADVDGTLGLATIQLQTSGDDIVLAVSGLAGGSLFETWVGGSGVGLGFDEDKNGDGIDNGMAFLLGAADPDADATGLLPAVSESGGDLILEFDCLAIADRGSAELRVEHSSDLGVGDPWEATVDEVPDSDDAVADNGVTFVVDEVVVDPLHRVTATIDSAEAGGSGRLFGRLEATE